MANFKCTNKVVGFLLYLTLDASLSPMKSSFQLVLVSYSYRPWPLTHLSIYYLLFWTVNLHMAYSTYIVKPFHTYCDNILKIFTNS